MSRSCFEGKVIAITGASRGIGRALAIALAQRGASLLLGARDEIALQETALRCRESGGKAIAHILDVTNPLSCKAFIETGVREAGRLDMLINNAGVTMIAKFDEICDLSSFETVMSTNYLGTVFCSHAALPHLKQSQGLIVGISSLCGKTGVPTRSAYVASKHAMQGFLDTLRIELSDFGVDVLVVSPSFVETDIRCQALNGKGGVWGQSNRDEAVNTMTLDRCTELILRGLAQRQREVIMTPKGKLIPWLKLLSPRLLDRLSRKAAQS